MIDFAPITGKSLLTKRLHAQFVIVRQFSHWQTLPSLKTMSVKC